MVGKGPHAEIAALRADLRQKYPIPHSAGPSLLIFKGDQRDYNVTFIGRIITYQAVSLPHAEIAGYLPQKERAATRQEPPPVQGRNE
jgi:hypothetical protein